jgi:hypothetical protein
MQFTDFLVDFTHDKSFLFISTEVLSSGACPCRSIVPGEWFLPWLALWQI